MSDQNFTQSLSNLNETQLEQVIDEISAALTTIDASSIKYSEAESTLCDARRELSRARAKPPRLR